MWRGYIYDIDQNEIDSYSYRGNTNKTLTGTKIGLPAGTYFIKIRYGASYCSAGNYKFKVNFTESAYWETEFNGKFSTADNIKINTNYSGSIIDGYDEDYYIFTLNEKKNVLLNFKHAAVNSTSENWRAYIFDINQNELYSFSYKGNYSGTSTSGKITLNKGTYFIRVRYGSSYCSTTPYAFSVSEYIPTPTLQKISNKTNGVYVSWSKVSNATGYIVYRKTGSGSWSKIATIGKNTTVSYLDKTAKNGAVYTYTVRAIRGSYLSGYNKTGLTTKYLLAPSISSVKSVSKGIQVNYVKNAKASGYYVYKKTGSGSWAKIATLKKNTIVSYTDTKVKKGTTCTYCVKAYSGKYASAYYTKTIKNNLKMLKQQGTGISRALN